MIIRHKTTTRVQLMEFQAFETDVSDFGLHDFINDSNFEQFIDLIRGEHEDPIVHYDPNYDGEVLFGDGFTENQFNPTPGDVFNLSSTDPNSVQNYSLPSFTGMNVEVGDGENDGDCTSADTTPTTRTKGTMVDRSKTLVTERRRRGRMKEKLYALRALVPNITKMDKASIIGDAVSYVQDLQIHAEKLKAEIGGLESSLNGGERSQSFLQTPSNYKSHVKDINHPMCKKIGQMDAFQVEEKVFYVRFTSNKGEGIAASLYKVIESLSSFEITSSNFTTASERYVLTFTVNARECGEEMNLSTLKLWVIGALLNQGFEFKAL